MWVNELIKLINELKLKRIHFYNKTVSKDLILLQTSNTWRVKLIWVDRKTVAFSNIYYFGCRWRESLFVWSKYRIKLLTFTKSTVTLKIIPTNILRQNERPCTVWVPKLNLGLKRSMFFNIRYHFIHFEVFTW